MAASDAFIALTDRDEDGLRPALRDAVQGGHRAALGVLQAPDHPQDLPRRGELGGDDGLHPGGVGDGGVVLPVGFGHHLGHPAFWI